MKARSMQKAVMKINIIKANLIACAAFALAFTTNAAEQMKPMKGGDHLLTLQAINTKAAANSMKPDDTLPTAVLEVVKVRRLVAQCAAL